MIDMPHTAREALINMDAFVTALGLEDAHIERTGISGEYEHCWMFTIIANRAVLVVEMPGCELIEVICPSTLAGSILNRVRIDGDPHDWEEALMQAKAILTREKSLLHS